MTREEALNILHNSSVYHPDYLDALNMAIEALEQEPCDDAISRELALEKMADYAASGYADSAEDFEEYSKIICELPPVIPAEKVGQWEWNQYDGNPKIGNWHCSQCHGIGKSYYDYCPYCKAKMLTSPTGAERSEE